MKASFLIAAPKSNSGKTMITLGLIKALINRGLKVQPFKCGPDYIDPMHHSYIAGRKSYNLDIWMSNQQHIEEIYQRQSEDADASIIEGVMGLFDGADKDIGSSADLAQKLNCPVVLVVDASSMAYSAAPLIYGFKNFNSEIKLKGVIFNKVSGESHYRFLKDAANDVGVESLGYVPRSEDLKIESRHLGLHLPGEKSNEKIVDIAAKLIEKHVDLDKLIQLCSSITPELRSHTSAKKGNLKIGLANDEAFNFSYQANIQALEKYGDIKFFSPLNDKELPDFDLIWLPGGYPEIFSEKLAANQKMKQFIKNHIENGKALIAECGGMMYLGKEIIDKENSSSEMAGIFNYKTSFANMKLHLGYRKLEMENICLKGHEFHYSNLENSDERKADVVAKNAKDLSVDMPVFRYKNCWASYMHLYLGEINKMESMLKHLGLNL